MNSNKPSNFMLELIDRTSQEINEAVSNDIAIVKEIDKKILNLVRERNYILYGLNCKCLAYHNARMLIGENPLLVWNEYKKYGFTSDVVKNAVMNIRHIFFDDKMQKFNEFDCTQIVHDEYGYGSDDIHFVFEDGKRHNFRITLDIKRYESEYLYKSKALNGYIYFCIKRGRDYYTYDISFDFHSIRDSIERWIDSGFEDRQYEFEHGTLYDNVASIFKEFEQMRSYDARDDLDE